MNELLAHLAMGMHVALSPINLALCFSGALIGTLIGVLPGIGPAATMSLLLPITVGLPPEGAIIMLAGIYYGAQYGGSTSSILLNMPGEASSVVTTLDGYQMARQGRAGPALAVAAIGSFFAGCIATVIVAATSPLLVKMALAFGPADYFALMLLGLYLSTLLAHGSILKSQGMVLIGLAIGLIGIDMNTSEARFTFGIVHLSDGVDLVALAMGLFGVTEIIRALERRQSSEEAHVSPVSNLWLNQDDAKRSAPAVARGTVIGSLLGVLPGGGALLASYASYAIEKKISREPSRFGKGAIEGVAGPEAANNAAAQTSFIPLLTLGLPTNAVMALLVGALIIQGIRPGPFVIAQQPQLFWGLISSMWLGNLMLVIINLPLIGIWVRLLRVRYDYLYPTILLACAIGVYSLNNSSFDIAITCLFGLFGYLAVKLGCELAPLTLGFVLGPMVEENFRRALMLSQGDPMTFFHRPISLTLLVILACVVVLSVVPHFRSKRDTIFAEEEN